MVETPDRVTVSLLMDGGQAGGNAGCNSYFTSYELDGSDLAFGQVGSTMMACLPPIMDLEQAYFENLGQVASYQSGETSLACSTPTAAPSSSSRRPRPRAWWARGWPRASTTRPRPW